MSDAYINVPCEACRPFWNENLHRIAELEDEVERLQRAHEVQRLAYDKTTLAEKVRVTGEANLALRDEVERLRGQVHVAGAYITQTEVVLDAASEVAKEWGTLGDTVAREDVWPFDAVIDRLVAALCVVGRGAAPQCPPSPEAMGRRAMKLAKGSHYVSTYCIHGADLHTECRRTCKHCQAPCQCACHLELKAKEPQIP